MKIIKLSSETEELFNQYRSKYRPESFRFEDSWQYIIQSCRKNGRIIQNKENIAFVGNHPENNDIVIANYFGNLEDLASLVSRIKHEDEQIIYKNANPQEVPILLNQGFRRYQPNERRDSN
jgi:hypothetical protein